MELSEAEKAGLSTEELAALEGEEDTSTGTDDQLDADEAEAKRVADEAKAAADTAVADKVVSADKAATDNAGADAAATTAETAERGEFTPSYHADSVEDFDVKMAELTAKFEAGDLKLADYNSQRDALNRQQLKAEISAESRAQTAEQRWDWEIERFHDDMKKTGTDIKADEPLAKQLDIAVKVLAGDPENENHSGRWFLEEGLKIAQARLGRTALPKAADATDEPKTAEEKRAKAAADAAKAAATRNTDRGNIPVTLGSAPAAAESEVGAESEFAAIEKLTGLEYERAIARLPTDAQERYARMAG